jgi:aminoglycoside phosphotransferase (APT) family kinase protein
MAHIQKSDMLITNGRIQAIIHAYDKSYKIKNIHVIEEGVANPVFVLETQKDDLVLRLINPLVGNWKAIKEELVYKLFVKHNIPCPIILKTDISRKFINFDYVISKRVKGQALEKEFNKLITLTSKTKIVKELGKYLGKIHSIKFNKFGDIAKKNNKFVVGPAHELSSVSKSIKSGPFKSWKEMHREILKSRLFYFKGTEFEDLVKPIKKYFKENEHLIDYKIAPRLLHLDLNRNNIFVKNNKITGILDVEESLIGHNEYDLMRTELHFKGNPKLRNAFFKEYTKYVKLDKGYEKRRPFYSLSRSLVGVRCLVLWKSRYTKKEYSEQKKWVITHIKKIIKENKLEL